jgi:hypothetical protein
MNSQLAVKTLSELVSCLEDSYFLCYGTALGAIREKNINSHDKDMDIGIMREDFKIEYLNRIIGKGFRLISMFGMLNCGLELSFKIRGITIDLMIFYQEKDLIWNSLWDNGGKNCFSDMIIHSYQEKLFEITKKELGGRLFYSLGIDYIEAVYGINWEKPITPWNWRTDHLCIDDEFKIKLSNKYGS